jgi:hypothetical protein
MILIKTTPLRSTAWTPKSQSGLQFWFDGSQLPGFANGDPLGTWPDLSGNARHASNTGSNRGTVLTNHTNGLSVVNCAISGPQYYDFGTDSIVAKGTAAIVVFVGYTAIGASNFRTPFSIKDGAAGGNALVAFESTGSASYQNFNFGFGANGGQVGWRNGSSDAFTTSMAAGIVYYDGTNTNATANWSEYKNNTIGTFTAPSGNLNTGATSRNLIGHFTTLGAGLGWDGPIGEIWCWTGVTLTSGLRDLIKFYIKGKWGITQA